MDPYVPPSSNEGTLQLFTDEDNFSSLPTVSSQDAQPRTSESKRSRTNYQEDQPAVPTPQFMDVPVNAPTQTPPSVHLRAMSGEAAFKVPSIEDPIGPFFNERRRVGSTFEQGDHTLPNEALKSFYEKEPLTSTDAVVIEPPLFPAEGYDVGVRRVGDVVNPVAPRVKDGFDKVYDLYYDDSEAVDYLNPLYSEYARGRARSYLGTFKNYVSATDPALRTHTVNTLTRRITAQRLGDALRTQRKLRYLHSAARSRLANLVKELSMGPRRFYLAFFFAVFTPSQICVMPRSVSNMLLNFSVKMSLKQYRLAYFTLRANTKDVNSLHQAIIDMLARYGHSMESRKALTVSRVALEYNILEFVKVNYYNFVLWHAGTGKGHPFCEVTPYDSDKPDFSLSRFIRGDLSYSKRDFWMSAYFKYFTDGKYFSVSGDGNTIRFNKQLSQEYFSSLNPILRPAVHSLLSHGLENTTITKGKYRYYPL